eukprot:1386363-Alexandrium_andersonii.AAC.1
MSASLVGSEMCIRDSRPSLAETLSERSFGPCTAPGGRSPMMAYGRRCICLLYTSDAADDM